MDSIALYRAVVIQKNQGQLRNHLRGYKYNAEPLDKMKSKSTSCESSTSVLLTLSNLIVECCSLNDFFVLFLLSHYGKEKIKQNN